MLKDFKQYREMTILHLDRSFCVDDYCETEGKDTNCREISSLTKKNIFRNM